MSLQTIYVERNGPMKMLATSMFSGYLPTDVLAGVKFPINCLIVFWLAYQESVYIYVKGTKSSRGKYHAPPTPSKKSDNTIFIDTNITPSKHIQLFICINTKDGSVVELHSKKIIQWLTHSIHIHIELDNLLVIFECC